MQQIITSAVLTAKPSYPIAYAGVFLSLNSRQEFRSPSNPLELRRSGIRMAEKVKARLEALRTERDEALERALESEEKVKAADARADAVSLGSTGCAE